MLVAASFAGVLAKYALREVEAFTFVWLQIAVGGVVLSLYALARHGVCVPRGLGRDAWVSIVWIGIGNFAIVRVVFMLALDRLPATTHVFLVNLVGLVTMGLSVLVLGERPRPVQLGGAVLALLGLWVFFERVPPPTEMAGVALVGGGVLALASTNVVARRLAMITGNGLSNTMISTVALWVGGVPVVIAGVLTDWPPRVEGGLNWAIIVLNGVVGIGVGLTVWNYILRTLRSYEASVLAGSTVIFTALFALPILGERLGGREVAGIVLMLVGLAAAQLRGGMETGAARKNAARGRE